MPFTLRHWEEKAKFNKNSNVVDPILSHAYNKKWGSHIITCSSIGKSPVAL